MITNSINEKHVFDQMWEYKNYRIIECQTCGFKHLDPIPNKDVLQEFYQKKYFREIKPFPYNDFTEEFIRNITESVSEFLEYNEIYLQVMQLKKTTALGMIDIGCGNNLLVKYFQKQGWSVCAVEPSEDAALYLKRFGIPVFNRPVEEIEAIGLNNVAFVNMQFVLEHLQNPRQILQKIYQLLEPGGVIQICVPNDFSEGQLAYTEHFQEQPRWVCLPDHINYFNFTSLSNLLKGIGFKEVYRTTNFPLEFLLMAGMNYYASEEERLKVGPIVANLEDSFKNTGRADLLKILYETLAQLGFGRSIFMYAIKE